jgi:hypothetical protein
MLGRQQTRPNAGHEWQLSVACFPKAEILKATPLLTDGFLIRLATMARTRTFLVLMMALGLVCCGSDSTGNQASLSRDAALAGSIEKQVLARNANLDLRRYARLYTHNATGNVEGTYLSPSIGGLSSKWEGGKSYWVDADEVPAVDDGGCAVISLLYNVRSEMLIFVSCNGDA